MGPKNRKVQLLILPKSSNFYINPRYFSPAGYPATAAVSQNWLTPPARILTGNSKYPAPSFRKVVVLANYTADLQTQYFPEFAIFIAIAARRGAVPDRNKVCGAYPPDSFSSVVASLRLDDVLFVGFIG